MLDPFHVHSDGDMHGLVAHVSTVADLHDQGVEVDHRVRASNARRCQARTSSRTAAAGTTHFKDSRTEEPEIRQTESPKPAERLIAY
jgi:hypothetical protein